MEETVSDNPEAAGLSGRPVVWFFGYLAAAAVGFLVEVFEMSPLSLPAGVALAATLTVGVRVWPAIFAASFLWLLFVAHDLAAGPVMLVLACVGGAAGITLGVTTAAGIVLRFTKGQSPFGRISDYLVFVGFGAVLSSLIAGSVVAACFSVTGVTDHYVGVWRNWFVADLLGSMVITPFVLAWIGGGDDLGALKVRKAEAVVLTLAIAVLSLVALGPLSEFVGPIASHPLILSLPLAWGALRFGIKGTTVWVLLVSLLAIWGTASGYGALNAASIEHPMPALQFMILVVAGTTFMIGAISAAQQMTERELIEANRRLGARVDERTQALQESEERLGNLSTTDDLTGASNRSYFLEMSKMEFYRARRYHRPLAVLMLDVDRFKSINDTHGHAAGDVVLEALTETCQEVLRASDIFGRIGGEEFAATLPDTDLTGAMEVAERLRQAIDEQEISIDSGVVNVTVSIGVSVISEQTTEYEILLKQADDALYRAKEAGRNTVLSY
ncbi:MAG: sensor domain-containing diguanylate cyclase [Rhodospirillales bacterium]|nr:sensor domain-containing diguanylate cyclase [Rhodospirillales bacterium]